MIGPRRDEYDEDALAKKAVSLYERDKENREAEASVKGALQEMQIPDTYYEAAKAEIYRERIAREAKRARFFRAVWIAFPVATVLAVASVPSILSAFHKPQPFVLGFANRGDWALEMSDGSIARVDTVRVGGQAGTRLTVNRFRRSTSSNFPGQFWVQENTTNGPFDLRGLHEATFTARGVGLNYVRFRFNAGDRDWISPAFTLTDQFQTYRINLTGLCENRISGTDFRFQGYSRVADRPHNVSIQVGQFVNFSWAKGFVEVGPIQFR